MDSTLKQRLIGAAVLAALAIIFLPMLLKGPDVHEPDAAAVPLTMPAAPGQEFETRELPLTVPEAAPSGGVLGMSQAPQPLADKPGEATIATTEDSLAAEVQGDPAADVPKAAEPAAATAAPTAAPTAGASAAVGAGNFVVNIGTFADMANATALSGKLRAARLPVLADRVNVASGAALRLRVGPYADRAAAEAARLRAESITGGASRVVALDASVKSVPAAVAQSSKPAAQPASAAALAAAPAAIPSSAKPTIPANGTDVAPPAAKPAAVAAPTAVDVSSGFAVQLSAPSVESEANALRDRARSAGFSSFVQRIDTDSGVRYRVRVGPVADRSAALAMRDAVAGKLSIKGIVVANP